MHKLTLVFASILIFAAPSAVRAQSVQGTLGVSVQILAPEELRVAGAATTPGEVRVERTRGGETRMSVPLVLTHRMKPTVSLQQRAGDARCDLLSAAAGGARAEEGWSTRLRCTAPTGASAADPVRARLVIVPNT